MFMHTILTRAEYRKLKIQIHSVRSGNDPVEYLAPASKKMIILILIQKEDIVVNMLPGSIGHISTSKLAEKPWRSIDLSFSESTPDSVDEKAGMNGASILWDTGIAPGLSTCFFLNRTKHLGV